MRRTPFVVLAIAGLLPAGAVRAETTATCIEAHESSQLLQKDGKLRAAARALLFCASERCPRAVQEDCARMLATTEAETPTIVIHARDGGNDAIDVHAAIDGEPVAERLDGRPLTVDPGAHEMTGTLPDGRTIRVTFLASVGEQNRRVELVFAAPSTALQPPMSSADTVGAPSPSAPRGPVPVGAWVAAGGSALALGSFTLFALRGNSKENALERCAPACRADDVHAMRGDYLVADLSLGVAVVALAAGVWIYLTRPPARSAAVARGWDF